MIDFSHLDALDQRLNNERKRLANAKTQWEQYIRGVWIAQIEKEIKDERKFLNLNDDLSDEELLKELGL